MQSTWETYQATNICKELPTVHNPTILAFSCYFHDSSACIIKDGKIVAAVDEERFSRVKHDASFPINAILYCLREAKLDKVDFVVFYENPDIKWHRIKETLDAFPHPKEKIDHIQNIWQTLKSKHKIQEVFTQKAGLNNEIIFIDHHLCHAASAYYVSGFEEAAVVTIDGVGEKATTTYGHARHNSLQISNCIYFPHSIGLLYTAITVFLGFKANGHEYKVMGLAPYGIMQRNENKYYKILHQMVEINNDGSFRLNMTYFGHSNFVTPAYTDAMCDLLSLHPNTRDGEITTEHINLAAALQMITEDVVFQLLNHVYDETRSSQLCYAGGVALNSVLNGKILSKTKFKELFIQPSAGDAGTVIGAAKYIQHLVDSNAPREHITHSSYGPKFSSEEIEAFLKEQHIVYQKTEDENALLEVVAEYLKQKHVVGWFQGRMEWGPRALGNRSILASPLYKDMRDILNAKVKHRELFRPFAPVICAEDVVDFFDCDLPLPEPTDYMLMVYPIKNDKKSMIPAVTHVDGSGRLQTIRKDQNPLYYKLIKKFGEHTGIPILVNTSFNIRGEPIVCSPHDAYRCMMGTEIDYLVINNFIVKRIDNLKDAWIPVICD